MFRNGVPTLAFCMLMLFNAENSAAQLLNKIKNKVNPNVSNGAIQEDRLSVPDGVKSSGIEMVVTKKPYAAFALARRNAIEEITDGDSVWLYIKSAKPFRDVVTTRRIPQEDGSVIKSQTLALKLGPNDNSMAYGEECRICFGSGKDCKYDDRVNPSALDSTEIRLNLTRLDPKGSSKVMLATVGNGRPGNWDNQIRLYLGDNTDPAAVVRLNCKVEDGIAKYKKLWLAYKDQQSKGDESSNELPEAAGFSDRAIQAAVIQQLKQKGITTTRFFFTKNNWTEIEESSIDRYRYMTAAFTYKSAGKCLYGLAYVRQNYAFGAAKYGPSAITFPGINLPIACEKL